MAIKKKKHNKKASKKELKNEAKEAEQKEASEGVDEETGCAAEEQDHEDGQERTGEEEGGAPAPDESEEAPDQSEESDKQNSLDFTLSEIKWKDSWTIVLVVGEKLHSIKSDYHACLAVSLNQVNRELRDASAILQKLETDVQTEIDEGYKESKLGEINDKISALEKQKQTLIDNCPDISFDAKVLAVKYKNHCTHLTLSIPSHIVNEINDHVDTLSNYLISLSPAELQMEEDEKDEDVDYTSGEEYADEDAVAEEDF